MTILPKTYLFVVICALLSLFSQAQVQRGGVPVSWNLEEVVDENHAFISLPEIDVEALMLEDLLNDEEKHVSQRFAFPHSVALDLDNSGRWTNLQNGDRIWQLAIYGEGASSLSVTFSDFFLLWVFIRYKNRHLLRWAAHLVEAFLAAYFTFTHLDFGLIF